MSAPMTGPQALARMRSLWCSGEVLFTRHATERMAERGIDAFDVEHLLLRTGRVVDASRPGLDWRYVVEGRDMNGTRLRCIVELNDRLLIVTLVGLLR